MSISGAVAKNAPVLFPLATGALAVNDPMLVKAGAVLVGLAFGALWRAGSLTSEGKGWTAVRKDLLVSSLIGGANAVLALSLVELMGIRPLPAMGIGVLVGATGLRALPEIKEAVTVALKRKLLGDDIALIVPRDEDMRDAVRRIDKESEG